MKKSIKLIMFIMIVVFFTVSCIKRTVETNETSQNVETEKVILQNSIFKLDMPKRFDGMYETVVKDNAILIYDKECKEEGYDAYIIGIYAIESPKDWATGPNAKVGELTLNNGKLYDIILNYATEAQYGFDRGMPNNYKSMYDARFEMASQVSGINGEKVDIDNGCKGENLYKEELNKHIKAITEKWDANKLENENMSPMYAQISSSDNALNNVGYAYMDINADGIDELFIGEIAEGNWKGIVYDMYTMVDRKPKHVVSGWDRNRYFILDSGFLLYECSDGAASSGSLVYDLVTNSDELFFQFGYKYDEYENKENPWYSSYDNNEDNRQWDNITESEYKDFEVRTSKHKSFEYIPFSSLQ